MALSIGILIGGLLLLIKGADWMVDGASALAKRYNISDLAIGLTIVAFGTSAPELVVNAIASYQDHNDIVFGNIIGSNNFNLYAILGISGLIAPLVVQRSTVWKEIPISFFAIVVFYLLVNYDFFGDGENLLSRIDGAVLLLFFFLFLYYVYSQLREQPEDLPVEFKHLPLWKSVAFIIGGLAGLVLGGRFVVSGAIDIAEMFDVSEKIIGLTIVAAGTSLPELATSLVAALKKNNDIAVGNIVGSNVFNLFLILSVSSLVSPLEYDLVFNRDILLLAAGTLFLFGVMFIGRKRTIFRWEAAVFLSAFIAYTVYLIQTAT